MEPERLQRPDRGARHRAEDVPVGGHHDPGHGAGLGEDQSHPELPTQGPEPGHHAAADALPQVHMEAQLLKHNTHIQHKRRKTAARGNYY